jgi:uncharacterized protein (TIGR02145 family)
MFKTTFLSAFIYLSFSSLTYGQVGIGTTSPHSSARLQIDANSSTNAKGFLPPRMTTTERDGITSPATGLTIYNTTKNCLEWWNGSFWYDGCGGTPYPMNSVFCASVGPTDIVDVQNPTTSKIWMDRNLGATRAATSVSDVSAYGDLYQWGRRSDGHQCRNSTTTYILSTTDQPANGLFILTNASPFDWRSTTNDNLWQGVIGVNNPCPSGYRLPTEAEWTAEYGTWSAQTASGGYSSRLKLPTAGQRQRDNGSLLVVGMGYYWSSTITSTSARYLYPSTFGVAMNTNNRAYGNSVRCIKN